MRLSDTPPCLRIAALVPVLTGFLFLFFCLPCLVWGDPVYRVRHVIDGDTIVLEDGRLVRYLGIDTPEIEHEGKPARPFGPEAHRMNAHLLENRKIRLEWDVEKKDRFGRSLAYVFLPDGTFVNRALVEAGVALCMPTSPNRRREQELKQAQRQAIRMGKGMWKSLETDNRPMIGHIRSRRFHSPDCPDGKNISRRNRIVFPGKQAAFLEGYYPCRRCLGTGP